jgi:hypothetical protein
MNLSVPVRDYAAFEAACGSLLYDPALGEGVIPYATGTLPLGKVGAACFARSPGRAAEIFADLVLRASHEATARTPAS